MRFEKKDTSGFSRIPMRGRPGTCQLRVRDLGVTLESDTILQGISFDLNCREIVALIGPNGAGKSSLFRSILGQIPYSGTIKFELAGGYPSRPKIGYVPQSPSFDRDYPISVLDFFAAAISRWPVFLPVPKSLRTKVEECLSRVHGEALIDKRIGTLSGGELQRVLWLWLWNPSPRSSFWTNPSPAWTWGASTCSWRCWTRSARPMICPSSSPPMTSILCSSMPTRSSCSSTPS